MSHYSMKHSRKQYFFLDFYKMNIFYFQEPLMGDESDYQGTQYGNRYRYQNT